MTDKEIIKALECCCKNNNCEGCPLDYLTFSSQCASELAIKSLDLINRQQAEIQRITEKFNCQQTVYADLSKIIKDQKAEIDRLKNDNEILSKNADNAFQDGLNEAQDLYAEQVKAEIKSEAIKEFAERLKNEIISETAYGCDSNQHTGYYDYQIKIGDIPEYIDNLVKEMVGEDK